MKLYNSLEVARQSVKNDKMMSAYMSEFVSFNVLDKDYVEAKEKKQLEDSFVPIVPNEKTENIVPDVEGKDVEEPDEEI